MTKPIYPCLWFDNQAKAAAEFYCSVFDNASITDENPFVVNFTVNDEKIMCLNGGSQFKINPSISFFVLCETLEETQNIWNKLSDGGSALMPLDKYDWSEKYGWVQDKFGVSWQISFGKMEDVGQKFTPALMFVGEQHGKAEQAINFYTSIFENSSVLGVLKYKEGETDPAGTVKHAQFTLGNYVMMAMDSAYAHAFAFNEAISFVVSCENQEDIDYYWDKLTEDGEEGRCGWLKDRFGVSWQIVPSALGKLMSNPEKGQKVMQAFMQMKKFDIAKLEQA